MTKIEAEAEFRRDVMPAVLAEEERCGGDKDRPRRAEAWNNYTDALCKEGRITSRQYSTWTSPKICD